MIARVQRKHVIRERDQHLLELYEVFLLAQGSSQVFTDRLVAGARRQMENGGKDHDIIIGLRAVMEELDLD